MAKLTSASFKKTAVDDVAKQYWIDLFKDTNYGELWVRDIPMRVTAELKKKSKIASTRETPEIRPLVYVIDNNGVSLEGLAVTAKSVKAFVIDFDHKGKVRGFDSVDAGSKGKRAQMSGDSKSEKRQNFMDRIPEEQSHSNQDFDVAQQIAFLLTDEDRALKRPAPQFGYSKENFALAEQMIREKRSRR